MEVFLAVAREGGFSRAADKLYRTQSAVSQAIRKLETEIGEPLFGIAEALDRKDRDRSHRSERYPSASRREYGRTEMRRGWMTGKDAGAKL